MKLRFQQVISLILVLCVIASTGIFSIFTVSAASTEFEADNSYLTYDEYRSLNFEIGSAEDCDKAKDALPLKSGDYQNLKFVGVEYGWTNPQVLTVMTSAPYWKELNYGSSFSSAGSTSFTVTTSSSDSKSEKSGLSLGVSVTASAKAEFMGNGVTAGYSYSAALSRAEAVQNAKTVGTSHTFTCGAGDDYVALMLVPAVAYKYEYTINGKTESMVINIQLDPVYGMTTIKNYNMVAKSHNKRETSKERMMPIIELDKIAKKYTVGDPSTCPSSATDIPESFNISYGDMELDERYQVTTDKVGENQLKGKVYSCDGFYTVGLGFNSFAQSVSIGNSSSGTIESGASLSASVFAEVSGGGDIGIVTVKGSRRLSVNGSYTTTTAFTETHSENFTYSMTFANIPQSAITGVTSLGIDKSIYSFNTKLAVWVPEQQGDKVWSAPAIMMPIVSFAKDATLPPSLPQKIRAINVTDSTVTLDWSTNKSLSSIRFPDKYKVKINTTGSVDSFTDYATIENYCQYELTGLKPDTTYTIAIQAIAGDGTLSVIGVPITVKTKSSTSPVIIKEPKNLCVDEGDKAIFEVIPEGDINNYTYQWYKLVTDRYGFTWNVINGANQNTFNAAYYTKDGKVNSSNRYDLDDSVYRCVVTDKKTNTNVVSRTVILYVSDVYLIESYNELKMIKEKIAMGEIEYIYKDYALASDITMPQGEVWTVPFGTEEHPYQGTFDGKGHMILNYNFNNKNAKYAGFFGRTLNADINNFNVYNEDYQGGILGGENTGGLVGKAERTIIRNSNVLIYVTGDGYAGGFVGYADVNTMILNCFARTVLHNYNENGYTGGAIGYNYGAYIDGMVTDGYMGSNNPKGGLVGFNYGTLKNSIYTPETYGYDCDAIGEPIIPAGENVRTVPYLELGKIYTYPDFIKT